MRYALFLVLLLISPHLAAAPLDGSRDGFSMLPVIYNQHLYKIYSDPGYDGNKWKGDVTINLDKVTQIINLHSASHFAVTGPNAEDDTRFISLKPVFKKNLSFSATWPAYHSPIHVALLKRDDGKWVLVANMGECFLLETEDGFGVVLRK